MCSVLVADDVFLDEIAFYIHRYSEVTEGWVLDNAIGINDNGWIVGNAHNSITGLDHAFLLTPVPEPETYALFMAGLGLLVFIARRRKNG